jgi:hypothetical protein
MGTLTQSWLWLVVGCAFTPAEVYASTHPVDQFAEIPLQPIVASFGREHKFPLDGIRLLDSTGPARVGDTVTVLITMRKSMVTKQWLAQFTIAEPTEKERAANPPRGFTLHADSGRTFQFSATASLALDIRIAGPFSPTTQPPSAEQHARTLISPDFLSLGLDEACRTMLALKESRRAKNAPAESPSSSAPVSGTNPQSKNPSTLSEGEERAMLGFAPALVAFLEGIQKTPGLREILWEMIEKPSVWSVIKHRGRVDMTLNIDSDAIASVEKIPWVPAGPAVFRMSPNIMLNQQPAIYCSLFVTTPQPPLLTTAGIVGLVATSPGSKPRRLDIQIVDAHRPVETAKKAKPSDQGLTSKLRVDR